VSVFNVVLGEVILGVAFGVMHWTARTAAITSTGIVTIPAYFLNRAWVWGKRGRSHLIREVVPFWILAFAGLAVSVLTAGWAESAGRSITGSRLVQTLIVMAASLAAFGIIWVARFVILNSLLFAEASTLDESANEPARL